MTVKPIYSIKLLVLESQKLIESHLWVKIIVFLVAGIFVGLLIGPEAGYVPPKLAWIIVDWLVIPGRVFLILMQMIILPLVLSSVMLGVINAKSISTLKAMAIKLLPYFVITTTLSILIGLSMAQLIKPGVDLEKSGLTVSANKEAKINHSVEPPLNSTDSLPKIITSILPKNPLSSMMDGNLFQIVIFALLLGVALLSLKPEQAKPIVTLLTATQGLTMVVVGWAMKLAPFAVFGLMTELLSKVGFNVIASIGAYALTVILSLGSIVFIYLLIVFFGARVHPGVFLKKIREVQLLAFSTSSSAAVMPLTIEVAEKKLNVSPKVSRLIIPLGTTINMDGTAAYQGVAACFIAQAYGLDLTMTQVALIVVTATGASIGAPGTPGVGIAVLASLLNGVGVPAEGVLLIMGVDRLLDMLRTVVNVTGDLTAALFFNKQLPDLK